jgi:hypothetical protein
MNIFEECAQEYFDEGMKVVPIKPNEKYPAIKNWQQEDFSKRIEQFASWGIGLQLGKVSGVIALDIDTDDKAILDALPPSPVRKRGQKGETRFFKYSGEKSQKFHNKGFEILSDGNQTVLPPSLHPDGMRYHWLNDDLLSYDHRDLPELVIQDTPTVSNTFPTGRHNALVEIAGAMIERGESVDKIISELIDYDNSNHETPYFTDKSERHGGLGYTSALKLVTSLVDTASRKGNKYSPTPAIEIDFDSPKEFVFKNELPTPDGHIKTLQDLIYKNSPRARSTLSLASAISTMGAIFSHKIRWGMTTPNLYQVMISGSSGGKNTPLMMPKKILQETKGAQFIGESPDTRAAFLAMLQNKPKMMLCIDEVNKMFTQMNNKQGHLAGIAEDLSTIYSIPLDFYAGKTTKGHGTEGACHSPHVSFLGACTEESLLNSLKIENITQGFGGRVLYMIDNSYSKKKTRMNPTQMPNDLTRFLAIWNGEPTETESYDLTGRNIMVYGMDDNLKPKLVELNEIQKPVINNAFCLDENFDDEVNDYYEELVKKSQGDFITQAVYGRAHENYSKIALIHACSKLDDKNLVPHIERSDMEFAKAYVDYCLERFLHFATVRLGESFEKKKENKVITAIKNNFDGEFNKREIAHKVGFGGSELKLILVSLINNGMIVITNEELKSLKAINAIDKHGVKFKLNQ